MRMRRNLLFLILLTLLPGGAQPLSPDSMNQSVAGVLGQTVTHYKWFHQNPELSNQEVKTAAYLAKEMRALGLEVTEGIGGTGIVGVLRNGPGPTVLYRADMDGLPVTEATGVTWASKKVGVMHACGHDLHMSVALGTVEVLAQHRQAWSGTLLFVGQPAEELGKGARAMVSDPTFQAIINKVGKPKVCLGFHDDAGLPAGRVGLKEGFVCANVDEIDIVLHGSGGHGAYPHKTVDPIVMGSEVVLALQTIVSRRLPPGTRAVVTVGRFDAGTKHNIIPPSATLLLTVRSYETEVREQIIKEIRRVVSSVARAHDAPQEPELFILDPYVKAGFNDLKLSDRARKALSAYFPAEEIVEDDATMGGEDFFEFGLTLGAPNLMLALGTVDREVYASTPVSELPGLHSDKFVPDPEPTLKGGVTMMSAVLLDAFKDG